MSTVSRLPGHPCGAHSGSTMRVLGSADGPLSAISPRNSEHRHAQGETTHFGEQTVALEDKQGLVNEVFHGVADRYDLMNDLMSGGVHRLWKDAMVARLAPPKGGTLPYRVLDMAGGTGDIAERIINASVGYAEVTVADINADMLRVGAERAKKLALSRAGEVRRGQCRGAAVRGRELRRLHDRLRHPQRAAHREGAERGPSRAQARRAASSASNSARSTCRCSTEVYKAVFRPGDPADGQAGDRRCAALPVPGRIDPQVPHARALQPDDRQRPASSG